MHPLRRLYLSILKKFKHIMPIKTYVGIQYEYTRGRPLDLNNPVELNQKIQWLKAFYHPPILHTLVDKYAVRQYVEEKAGKQYLNELIAVYDNMSEINFDALPEQYVMKVVHGCGYNLIVPDKHKLNLLKAKLKLFKWTHKDQYQRSHKEWAYKGVKPRIIVEKFLQQEEGGDLIDYKFYCFNGKAEFVEVHHDRNHHHLSSFYDLNYQQLPFRDVSEEHMIKGDIKAPERFSEMVDVANKLAGNLPFVRVDLYYVNKQIVFGEMTFYPGSGTADFYPPEYNKLLGDKLTLPRIPTGEKEIKFTQ